MQKRLFDIGWSDECKCQACPKEEGTEKRRLYHWPGWYEIRREIPQAFRKLEQKQEPQRRSGSGKEVSSSTLQVKAKGTRATSGCKSGSLRSTTVGACQQKVSKVTLPRTALFWVQLESGGLCMGCTAQWRQNLRFSASSRGRERRPFFAFSRK